MNRVSKILRSEAGFTVTFFALMMPVFLAILGLCADGSFIIYNKIALDKASDAAGLATIDSYDRESWLLEGKTVLREDKAWEYATMILQSNMSNARLIHLEIPEDRKNECRIETEAEVPTFFLKIFLIHSYKIRAYSVSYGN